jgi:hypothetical protein
MVREKGDLNPVLLIPDTKSESVIKIFGFEKHCLEDKTSNPTVATNAKKNRQYSNPPSVADPGTESGAFLTPGSGIGTLKIKIRDEHPASDFQELNTIFWVKLP